MARKVRLSLQSELQQKIFRLFDEGMSSAEIATECGVSREYVWDACMQSGRSYRAKHKAREASLRTRVVQDWLDGMPVRLIAEKNGIHRQTVYSALEKQRELDAAQVPAWVPSSLHDQYRSIAYDRGEPDAAAWARSAKKVAV